MTAATRCSIAALHNGLSMADQQPPTTPPAEPKGTPPSRGAVASPAPPTSRYLTEVSLLVMLLALWSDVGSPWRPAAAGLAATAIVGLFRSALRPTLRRPLSAGLAAG